MDVVIWGYIFGGATLFGLIVGVFSVYNGRMTRREISSLIQEESRLTRESTRELIERVEQTLAGVEKTLARVEQTLERTEKILETNTAILARLADGQTDILRSLRER